MLQIVLIVILEQNKETNTLKGSDRDINFQRICTTEATNFLPSICSGRLLGDSIIKMMMISIAGMRTCLYSACAPLSKTILQYHSNTHA